MMASSAGLMMNAAMAPPSMAASTGSSITMTTAPNTMVMQHAAMASAPPPSASRMMDMTAPVGKPEPGPGQRALADEAFALEYNRLVDYHTRYPNFWSPIRCAD